MLQMTRNLILLHSLACLLVVHVVQSFQVAPPSRAAAASAASSKNSFSNTIGEVRSKFSTCYGWKKNKHTDCGTTRNKSFFLYSTSITSQSDNDESSGSSEIRRQFYVQRIFKFLLKSLMRLTVCMLSYSAHILFFVLRITS